MRSEFVSCLLGCALIALCSGLSRGQTARAGTVLDGVYTAAQAQRGQTVYDQANCSTCHEGGDADGPELTGDAFLDRWREDTLESLWAQLKTRMPADAPGSLSESAYVDILSYLLKTNNFPAGSRELTEPAIKTTLLVGHDGPKPLPTNAVVQTVGCLAPGPNNAWLLNRASEPVRTKAENPPTAAEIKLAEAQPMGNQTFRLLNIGDAKPAFTPSSENGHRIMAKGVLVRDSNGDRINTATLLTFASSCSP